MDKTSAPELAWEYHHQIRPWAQVYFYLGIQKLLTFFKIESPFIFATFFRIITSLIGLYSTYTLIPLLKKWIQKESSQKLAFFLLNFSWFIPYIHARSSAESLTGSLFIIGLSHFLKEDNKKHSFWAGILFGASYLVRFQAAILTATIWFWALLSKKKKISSLLSTSLAIIIVILFGIWIDYLGYGNWTFTPYNYFEQNILQDKMSSFGTSPVWYYLTKSFSKGVFPVSLVFILTSIWCYFKKTLHPISIISIVFVVFHSALGHKELRFLFPIIVLSPILFVLCLEHFEQTLKTKRWYSPFYKFVASINLLILLFASFRPANPAVDFYQFIWENPQIQTITTSVENPFTMLGLNLNYYIKDNFKVNEIKDYQAHLKEKSSSSTPFYLFFNKGHYIFEMNKYPQCKPIYMAYPKWALKFNIGNWLSRSRVWSLYRCHALLEVRVDGTELNHLL